MKTLLIILGVIIGLCIIGLILGNIFSAILNDIEDKLDEMEKNDHNLK